MARYIDADYAPIYLSASACEQIKRMPTEDVVKVVRCKDCKKAMETTEKWNYCEKYFCDRHHSFVLADDFCSYGVKGSD